MVSKSFSAALERITKYRRKYFIKLSFSFDAFVFRNKEEISRDSLADASLLVIGAQREEFTDVEAKELTQWVNSGGRVLMMTSDNIDGDERLNLSNFLGRFVGHLFLSLCL
jgi:hypothetical protein